MQVRSFERYIPLIYIILQFSHNWHFAKSPHFWAARVKHFSCQFLRQFDRVK